jgi:hypothetical protein
MLLSKIPETAAGLEYLSTAPVQERPAVAPRSAKMMARQTVGCGAVCDSSQVSRGRIQYRQSLLIFVSRARTGFVTADLASMTLPSASRKGFVPLTICANRYYHDDGQKTQESSWGRRRLV